ncbi:MAG: class I poly(R)-hydroxyalkanoic acid synthase, partial [Gammaproteobacteria bacterium]
MMNEDVIKAMDLPDPMEVTKMVTKIVGQSQRLVLNFMQRQTAEGSLGMADPTGVGAAFVDMTTRLMFNPAALVSAQVNLWNDYVGLWQRGMSALVGGGTQKTPATADPRFSDDTWQDNILFDFVKQSYLLTARWVQTTVKEAEGMDEQTAKKVDFFTRQFVDALSPTNFVLTNPEVLRATVESSGQNLLNGLSNLLDDL